MEWFQDVKVRVASLRLQILSACVEERLAVAFDLQKVTPAYDHVVSDDRFVLKLAKKHQGAAWVASHFVAWQLGEDILIHEILGERVTTATKILQQAQLGANIVGAVALLADTQRPDRQHKATKYLGQKDGLPKALTAALEKI